MADQTERWTSIVFMQGDEADEVLNNMLRWDGHVLYQGATEESVNEAFEYLKGWDYGDESEHTITDEPEWGSSDQTIEQGEYVLAYNAGLGYISLNRKVPADRVPPAPVVLPPNPIDMMLEARKAGTE